MVGIGAHYFLSERFNVTFSAQYMLHLGQHLDYELTELDDKNFYLETDHSGAVEEAIETHLLLTLSLNYRIADLW